MYDGNSSEDDYWNELLVKMIGLDELDDDNESDTEDGFRVFDGDRQCFLGGEGTSRPNCLPPRPFITGENGEADCRRHFGMEGRMGSHFFPT